MRKRVRLARKDLTNTFKYFSGENDLHSSADSQPTRSLSLTFQELVVKQIQHP